MLGRLGNDPSDQVVERKENGPFLPYSHHGFAGPCIHLHRSFEWSQTRCCFPAFEGGFGQIIF